MHIVGFSYICISRCKFRENVQSLQFFPPFCFFQISCSKFWVERISLANAQILFDFDLDQIPLTFLNNFSFDNQTFKPIYCCAVVQILSNLHENKLFWTGKKSERASCKLCVVCIVSLLSTVHTLRECLYVFYAHCNHQDTEHQRK